MGSLPPPSLPECLTALPGHASDALRNLRAPPPPSLSVSLSASPPVDPFALLDRSLATIPYRRPSPSSAPCFSVSLATARSLELSEARPLVFLLFPSRLRLLLVITTNLSRINSPSGINSSTVQAEKEKVIARGSGRANPPPPFPRAPVSTHRSVPPTEKEKGNIGVECRARSVMLCKRGWKAGERKLLMS